MKFAKNLKKHRESYGYSQLEIAKALNISDRTVSLWERGESIPRLDLAIKLSVFLGITLNDLVDESNQAEPVDSVCKNAVASEILQKSRQLLRQHDLSEDELDLLFQTFAELYFKEKSRHKLKKNT